MRIALALVAALAACGTTPARTGERPSSWAQPLESSALPNLHAVAPGLLRGAMPTDEGFRELERRGVRTVISLRRLTRDVLPTDSRLEQVEIPMWTWKPDEDQIVEFLEVATDPARQPVFVHCHHGADRTGLMCASFRAVVQGWTKDEALAELREGGFGHHEIWDELAGFLRELDVERVRARLRGAASVH